MEVMLKEAKLKALNLLTVMDRTEAQLRQKLLQKDYPESIVEQAIEYVKSFGYIDDEKYAVRFVENRRTTKSKQELRASLYQKGIAVEYIDAALEEAYSREDEWNAIRAIASKRKFSAADSDETEKKKLISYLARKGFKYEDIRKALEVSF